MSIPATTMKQISAHLESCSEATLALIQTELSDRGPNKSKYPINIGQTITAYGEPVWHVNIEVNSPAGTFDVEETGANLAETLDRTLTSIRRHFARAKQ